MLLHLHFLALHLLLLHLLSQDLGMSSNLRAYWPAHSLFSQPAQVGKHKVFNSKSSTGHEGLCSGSRLQAYVNQVCEAKAEQIGRRIEEAMYSVSLSSQGIGDLVTYMSNKSLDNPFR